MKTNERASGILAMTSLGCLEISDAKFKELFDSFRIMIEETSFGKKSVPPLLSLEFRQIKDGMPGDVEGALIVVDADFGDHDAKREMLQKVGAQCFVKGWYLVSVMMSSEAWMSSRKKEDPDFSLPPSKDPNRKECIMIAGRTLMGEIKMGHMIPVERDKDDNMIKGGEPTSTSELDTLLLDHVLIGFRKAAMKIIDSTKP
jgi:hypothetical protein